MSISTESLENDGTEDPVAQLARERFQIPYLMPLQRMVIANIMDSLDSTDQLYQMALFPTGFGKSICFQLPALFLPGLTVIVYPLLALMADQKQSLDRLGIPCSLLRGGLAIEEVQAIFSALKQGASNIVITNPESLSRPDVKSFLSTCPISHLAIDEAHCVSEWGETFRPAYQTLGEIATVLKPKVLSAFTATASPTVEAAIARYLFAESNYTRISTDIDKPNIHYHVLRSLCPRHSLEKLLRECKKPALVFCQSREGTRILAEMVEQRLPFESRFYHAGLEREEKTTIEAWFMKSDNGILLSTCAYGMGVNKKNIRTVIHYGSPASAEAYIQEAGRAGRDGEAAEAILLKLPREDQSQAMGTCKEDMSRSDAENHTMREARRKAFLAYGSDERCLREQLLGLMGANLDSPCSGCSVCNGIWKKEPDGQQELVQFFSANPYRFTFHQSIGFLMMQAENISTRSRKPRCRSSGVLQDWQRRDIILALRECLRTGILKEKTQGLRKGRIGIEV